MARQLGESIAQQHGFSSFPIDPFQIAKNEEIIVEAKSPEIDGMSGCIVFNGDGVGIIYSTRINNVGFQRFTVAHELGHYFISGHPEEILKSGPMHVSRAGFTQGNSSIELEADHFASGLLMPGHLVKDQISNSAIGLAGIQDLSVAAQCSLTSAAIRTAECASFPMAIIVSRGNEICYGFLSDSFKSLGKLSFLRKGDQLPKSITLSFNLEESRVQNAENVCGTTTLSSWFDGTSNISLDEEVIGLGTYGLTLTILSSDALKDDPYEEENEEEMLLDSWTPRFSYRK